jgi:hypothetical protein
VYEVGDPPKQTTEQTTDQPIREASGSGATDGTGEQAR